MPACARLEHDCVETRACSGPKGFIETGGTDDWWEPSDAGAGGEWGVGFPLPEAASPKSSADAPGAAGNAGSAGNAEDSMSNGESPAILDVMPADGATGVLRDVAIVIHFAQAMNTDATEGAYQSSELPILSVSFSWDPSRTTLTITPRAALSYAVGTLADPALTYHYGFNGNARALGGQTLAAAQFTFSTLREVQSELRAEPERTGNWTDGEGEGIHNCLRAAKAPYQPTVCVGDDANNVRYSGFLSFDLSELPAEISSFSGARLLANAVAYGAPETLGENHLEQVSFEQLGDAALHAAPLAVLGPFYTGPSLQNATHLVLSEDLTSAVQDDYANRVARQSRSQYRLSFANIAADGGWDDLELPTSGIRLALTYLLP